MNRSLPFILVHFNKCSPNDPSVALNALNMIFLFLRLPRGFYFTCSVLFLFFFTVTMGNELTFIVFDFQVQRHYGTRCIYEFRSQNESYIILSSWPTWKKKNHVHCSRFSGLPAYGKSCISEFRSPTETYIYSLFTWRPAGEITWIDLREFGRQVFGAAAEEVQQIKSSTQERAPAARQPCWPSWDKYLSVNNAHKAANRYIVKLARPRNVKFAIHELVTRS